MATFEKLIHMSTTSIYGDINGLCAEKDADDSSIHYVVEQMLGTFCKKNQKKFISVRCGGLMGYDRFPCKYYNDNSVVRNGNSGVNYVHRDDAVEVLVKLVENKTFEGAINLCAPLHPSRQSIIENCASKASRSFPIFEPSKNLGKLVSTELLEKKIGHLFRYPNPLDFFYDFMQ
jgi:nucleoside-diphosphate-sugar epimerase